MPRHHYSRAAYRVLLRLYPDDFRDRFSNDLESDFAELLHRRGRRAAWRQALADLVRSLRLTHEDARTVNARRLFSHPPGDSVMASVWFDVRHAVRSLFNTPAFTAVTVLTLALGIGANSAIFSLVNAALIRPIGYHDTDRLMLIYEGLPSVDIPRFGVSPADYADLVEYQQAFSAIGAYRGRSFELSGAGEAERLIGAQLTSAVFPLLGVAPAQGRTLLADDERSQERVVVISDGLWQRRFGGQAVLGQRITLDRQPYTIVGIMPATFQFPRRGPDLNAEPADVWMPLVFNPFERQARGMFFNHSVIGRLKDGMSVAQATADIAALAERIHRNYPPNVRSNMSLTVTAIPLADELFGQVRRPLLVLLGAVALVLLIACANVANLFLTRAVARAREIGVRVALGAAHRRLFQMLLIESLLLAFAAGGAGLLIGYWAIRAMPAAITTSLPGIADVALDVRVVGFTFALSALTAIGFGLVPLIAGLRRDVNDLLREGATRTTAGARQHRVQATLVMSSVAFAFVLLVGAGLLIRSLNNLLAVDTGLHAGNVLTMRVALPYAGYNVPARVRAFHRDVHDRLQALPGVRAVSVATDLPLSGDGERRAFTPERIGDAGGVPPSVAVTWMHGDYFGSYGIPLVRGRAFRPEEEAENRNVAIVSRNLAERFWPGEDPIGKRVKWGFATSTAPWNTVVGVAGDVVDGALGNEPMIHVYVPYADVPDQQLATPIAGLLRLVAIAVHTDDAVDASRLATSARAVIASLDPALALTDVQTMAKVMRDASAPRRFSAVVLGAFAAGALLMAAIGLYGVLAFGVTQRTREIGVRLALGARAPEVVRLIVREGMLLACIGLAIGFVASLGAVRAIASQLYATETYDPLTFALVPLVLGVVVLIACYLPARRAAHVDPVAALRAD